MWIALALALISAGCELIFPLNTSGDDDVEIFDANRVDAFRAVYEDAHGELTLPVLAGILPILTRRHAEFLQNEVPGIDIPEEVRKRIGQASDERAEGLAVATELEEALRARTAGVYLIPPFRRYDLAAEFVEHVRGA